MNNNDNKLYLYTDTIDLVITTSAMYVDNLPMNKRTLRAHKGLTNEIFINVRDRDRKPQNVFNQTLRLYVINPTTKKRILTRVLENTDKVGIVKLVISEGDLVNVRPGLYHAYISRSVEERQDMPIYSDHNNNIRFDLDITDQTGTTPPETQSDSTFLNVNIVIQPVITSQVITDEQGNPLTAENGDFLITESGSQTEPQPEANISVSNAFFGNLHRNFHNAQHTAAIYPDDFTGTVKIQASCLTAVPPTELNEVQWFDVDTLEFDSSSKIKATTFVVNCNWIRFVITAESGSVSQVLLRN
jgi:hypothetical protein